MARFAMTWLRPLALLCAFSLLTSMIPAAAPSWRSQAAEPVRPAAPPANLAAALAGLPRITPFETPAMGMMAARLINASMPFSTERGPSAAPFIFTGGVDARERAVDCLASAMWYEAGNDPRGQRAVGQVVLNRVRHPAFPASVCGVVFQGSERRTGCQFTFSCDGALARAPTATGFARARLTAEAMLAGVVDRDVGLATHYHTDWVAPAWSPQMAKIAQVDTHLFFRWPGKTGGAAAMAQHYAGSEPAIAALAPISLFHRMALAEPAVTPPAAPDIEIAAAGHEAATLARPPSLSPIGLGGVGNTPEGPMVLAIAPASAAGAPAMAALKLCGDRSFCKVVGKVDGSSSGDAVFLYVRDRRTGVDRAFWDCERFHRSNSAQCLSGDNRRWLGFEGNFQTANLR